MDWISFLASAAFGGLAVGLLQFFTESRSIRLRLKWEVRHRLYIEAFDAMSKYQAQMEIGAQIRFDAGSSADSRTQMSLNNLVDEIDFRRLRNEIRSLGSARVSKEFIAYESEAGFFWTQIKQFDSARILPDALGPSHYSQTSQVHLGNANGYLESFREAMLVELKIRTKRLKK